MIHCCKVQCHTMDPEKLESMGMNASDDKGKWLPFVFKLSSIEAAKLTTDDPDEELFGMTTIFNQTGESFIIDTPFDKFLEIFSTFNTAFTIEIVDEEEENQEKDLKI